MDAEDGFEWDPAKAEINFRKHEVRFEETRPVFDDPYSLTVVDDESDPNEQRFVTVGLGALGRILVVAYTYRGRNIRPIHARRAEPHEREEYTRQMQGSATQNESLRLLKRNTGTRSSTSPRTRRKNKNHNPAGR